MKEPKTAAVYISAERMEILEKEIRKIFSHVTELDVATLVIEEIKKDSLSSSGGVSETTDEEIEKEAHRIYPVQARKGSNSSNSFLRDGFCNGAFWMRSRSGLGAVKSNPITQLVDSYAENIEDPNLIPATFRRKVFRNGRWTTVSNPVHEKVSQNVGMNKRDAQLLIQYCQKHPPFRVLPSKPTMHSHTKLTAPVFSSITGWKERTSSHSRDAAMLVYKIR